MTYRIVSAVSTALLLLVGTAALPASAQEVDPTYELLTLEASRLIRPSALLSRTRVPAQIDSLAAPSEAAVGETVSFQAFTNAECAALPVQARWQFSDGTTASGLHAEHRFGAPGTHTAVFTFSNRRATVTDSVEVRVQSPRLPQ